MIGSPVGVLGASAGPWLRTKPEIALAEIDRLVAAGVRLVYHPGRRRLRRLSAVPAGRRISESSGHAYSIDRIFRHDYSEIRDEVRASHYYRGAAQ